MNERTWWNIAAVGLFAALAIPVAIFLAGRILLPLGPASSSRRHRIAAEEVLTPLD